MYYTWFKNVPMSVEDWSSLNTRRAANAKAYLKAHPGWPLKDNHRSMATRPCMPYVYGPNVYTEEAARKVCEDALKQGAQLVGYVAATKLAGRPTYHWMSTFYRSWWEKRKGKDWYEVARTYP